MINFPFILPAASKISRVIWELVVSTRIIAQVQAGEDRCISNGGPACTGCWAIYASLPEAIIGY